MATSVEILLQLLVLAAVGAMASPNNTLSPTCVDKCGDLSIPYPFGIGPNCSLTGFEVTCNYSETPPKPLLGGSLEIVDISLHLGQARVYMYISYVCYNKTSITDHLKWILDLGDLPFMFSETLNKFTAIGCETFAFILGGGNQTYASGCVSTCNDLASVTDGSCSGTGCCQISIPKGLKYYEVDVGAILNHSDVYQFNPCSYAFLGDMEWFQFNESDIIARNFLGRTERGVPLVLDWAIGNQSCAEAKLEKTTYACLSEHSDCINSSHGLGYLCNCSSGYEGNPYLSNGCQDINECEDPEKYPCYGKCQNVEGNYTCSCPPGTRGDPSYQGRCRSKFPLVLKLVVGISGGILLILVVSFYMFMVHKKRKFSQAKQDFFERNGGVLLYDKIKKEPSITFRIFKKEELKKATNKFDKNLELGRGGHGMVYEGILDGIEKFVIKKAKIIDESQKEEFAKEMIILSRINHRNVVKLVGGCLEIEVPILVYEYVPNGTLAHHIHQMSEMHLIPLDARLRIAIESAGALAYLHSSSPPIVHGNVKSSNILLDDNYVAKVSYFGASVLIPKDDAQFAALVQETRGYLDPEYLQTGQLTEKSDVYSFGVVLLELLTGKKALYFEGSMKAKSLALAFLSAMKEDQFVEILDGHITKEGDMELLQELAKLIWQCLSIKGEERPTMKEVTEKLHRFKKYKQHPSVQYNPEETKNLLGESSSYHALQSATFYGLEKRAAMHIEAGR